jgi:thiamine-phosphate pyrophosphorylase
MSEPDFKIIAVTNRALCGENFMERLEKLAGCGVSGIVLRESDLSPEEYEALARQAMGVCAERRVEFTAHRFIEPARRLGCERIQLPLPALEEAAKNRALNGLLVGASVHSGEEALRAVALGAKYLVAGHVFQTDSKKGLPGRGPKFIAELRARVSVPIYAIGGIDECNIAKVRDAGADGACLMRRADVAACMNRLRAAADPMGEDRMTSVLPPDMYTSPLS